MIAGDGAAGADGDDVGASPAGRREAAALDRFDDDLIVCTRHRPDEVRVCLTSVREQTRRPRHVVVVDSSEDDRTAAVVADLVTTWPDDSTLEHLPSTPSLTHQRNVGLDATAGAIVHFVDDDTRLEPGYVAEVLETFAVDATGDLGGVGGFVTNQPEHRFRRIDCWLGLDSPNEGNVLPSGRNVRVYQDPGHDLLVDWLSGCSMSYRRVVLDAERPDESIPHHYGGEDVDLSYRVRQRWRLVVTPRARLAHFESPRNRASLEAATTAELVSRWRRVQTGAGRYRPGAFWLSAWGQAAWFGGKGLVTASPDRLRLARATLRGIAEILRRRTADS